MSEWLYNITREVDSPVGNFFVTLVFDSEGKPVDLIITHGKAGRRERADAQAMGFLASLALEHGAPLSEIRRKLRGISSDQAIGLGPNKIGSLADAIARALARMIEEDFHGEP